MDIKLRYTRAQNHIFFEDEDAKYKIITKGRRFGFTRGCAQACIEWLLDGTAPILWVDTIFGNIDRYMERYFIPALKENEISYAWNAQKKMLHINGSYLDFRSSDKPENIEGFGYRKIILNEAGIILKNDYLYNNAILPMMLDYPDSQLIAGGAPKGKFKKDGSEHKFHVLFSRAGTSPEYKAYQYSSYDNPLLRPEDIKALELEMSAMSPEDVLQEVYGEFIDKAGSNPFFFRYDKSMEDRSLAYDKNKILFIGMDFNLNPFGFVYAHIWQDRDGMHFHIFDEETIDNANIDKGVEYIRTKYGVANVKITGDSMGNRKDFGQKDNATYYERIERGLGLRQSQLVLPPNPTHENSRSDCNFMLSNCDFRVNPDTAPNTARDLLTVQCDAYGSLIKKNRNDLTQRADHADCVRYLVNAFMFDWIRRTQKNL